MYKVGEHIACWDPNDSLKNVYGQVIDIVGTTEGKVIYKIIKSDGSLTTITFVIEGKRLIPKVNRRTYEFSNYENYSSKLYSEAKFYLKSIENGKNYLKDLLGDEYSKAREIAENCPERYNTFNVGDKVIVYPVEEKAHKIYERREVEIAGIRFSNDYRLEEYCTSKGFDKSCYLPIYDVRTDNNECFQVLGTNDLDYSGYFIGTKEELVRLLVNMIDKTIEEVEKIESLRKKLYNEIKGTEMSGMDRILMESKIDIPNVITKEKRK